MLDLNKSGKIGALVLIFTLIILSSGCISDSSTSESENQIIVGESPDLSFKNINETEDKAQFVESGLNATITHGGGNPNKPANIKVYWNENWQKTNATYLVDLKIVHTDYDYAQAYVWSSYSLNASKIRSAIESQSNESKEELKIETDDVHIHKRLGNDPYHQFE
jgi:hypothetical protein